MEIDMEKLQKELLAIKEMNAFWENRQSAIRSVRNKSYNDKNNGVRPHDNFNPIDSNFKGDIEENKN